MKHEPAPFVKVGVQMHHPDPAFIPTVATRGSSGFDLRMWNPQLSKFCVGAGRTALVPTGVRIALPRGYEAQIRMRSGLALQGKFFIPNSPSTIDSDYRGEVFVMIRAFEDVAFEVGDRIAQMVLCPVLTPHALFFRSDVQVMKSADDLAPAERGEAGFGSTGIK